MLQYFDKSCINTWELRKMVSGRHGQLRHLACFQMQENDAMCSTVCLVKLVHSKDLRVSSQSWWESDEKWNEVFFLHNMQYSTMMMQWGVNDVLIRDRSRWLISHPTVDYLISCFFFFLGRFTVFAVALFLAVFVPNDAYYVNAPLRNMSD